MIDRIVIISDVDGVLTDGLHYYTEEGKKMKAFGNHDRDAIAIFKSLMDRCGVDLKIHFVTDDKDGFFITKSRVQSWCDKYGVVLEQRSQESRCELIKYYNTKGYFTIYVGDSFIDFRALKLADWWGMPNDGWEGNTSELYQLGCVAQQNGGHGALAYLLFNFLYYKYENIYNFSDKIKFNNYSYSKFVVSLVEDYFNNI